VFVQDLQYFGFCSDGFHEVAFERSLLSEMSEKSEHGRRTCYLQNTDQIKARNDFAGEIISTPADSTCTTFRLILQQTFRQSWKLC
jgi:hypothetical protein